MVALIQPVGLPVINPQVNSNRAGNEQTKTTEANPVKLSACVIKVVEQDKIRRVDHLT